MLESLGRVGSLRRGILGLRETFGLSLALLALVMASSLATSSAALLGRGRHAYDWSGGEFFARRVGGDFGWTWSFVVDGYT